MKINAFKQFVKNIKEELSKPVKDSLGNDKESDFAKAPERKKKKIARRIAVKEEKKHYKKHKIKHFGSFKPTKPLNW